MNEQQLRYIHAIEKEESIQKASSSLGDRKSTRLNSSHIH